MRTARGSNWKWQNAVPARPAAKAVCHSLRQARNTKAAFAGRLTSSKNSPPSTHDPTLSIQYEMSSYVSQYPPVVEFDPAYKEFFENFYATSDTAEAHEEYAQYFTKDATLVMASKTVVGREGLSHCFFRPASRVKRLPGVLSCFHNVPG
jgi:hypothetical protein